ncbi:MAG: glycosylasparaginase, partial [Sphingobacteriales bacterium]
MFNRRKFIKASTLSASLLAINKNSFGAALAPPFSTPSGHVDVKPIVISTWDFGIPANQAAWKVLAAGGRALDAVEQGVWVPEADPNNQTVGYGGMPDRDGHVTLDACIMDELGNCGSVAGLEHIVHPISVARMVMEKTPHVMLVGDGALQFALENGFKKVKLLTAKSEKAWKEWLKT